MIKRNIRYIIYLSFLLAYLVFSINFTNSRAEQKRCNNIRLIIEGQSDNQFISKQDINRAIQATQLNAIGCPSYSINDLKLEEALQKHPHIKNVEVYKGLKGQLCFKVLQREPILRLIQKDGYSYYIDKEGLLMPLSKQYSSRVLVVTGHFKLKKAQQKVKTKYDVRQNTLLNRLFILAQNLEDNPFWKSMCNQLNVNKKQDIILLPKIGAKRITLSQSPEFKKDFAILNTFYKEVLPVVGWDKYQSINLKYRKQIVCEK